MGVSLFGGAERAPGCLEQEFKSAQELQRILIPERCRPLAGYAVTSAYIPRSRWAETSSS